MAKLKKQQSTRESRDIYEKKKKAEKNRNIIPNGWSAHNKNNKLSNEKGNLFESLIGNRLFFLFPLLLLFSSILTLPWDEKNEKKESEHNILMLMQARRQMKLFSISDFSPFLWLEFFSLLSKMK